MFSCRTVLSAFRVGIQEGSGSGAPSGSSSGSGAMNAGRSVNPFVSNPHGHPSFNPVKLGTKGTVSYEHIIQDVLLSSGLEKT